MARDLRVVIATAGTERPLARTLASLTQCRRPETFREVIVVENGPAGSARDDVARFASQLKLRYLHVTQPGKSHALNCVLDDLPYEALVFMSDDDVRFREDTLIQYADAAAGVDRGHFYGGPVQVDYDAPPPEWLKAFLPFSAVGWYPTAQEIQRERLRFMGFNWAAFVGDICRAGGFDADYGPGSVTGSTGQESQMQRVLCQAGVRPRFVPEALVWHYVPRDRCSTTWAVQRAYRDGMQKGIRLRDKGFLECAALLAWAMLNASARSAAFAVSGLLPSARMRFGAHYHFERARGWLVGCAKAFRARRSAGASLAAPEAVSPPQSRRAA